MVGIHKRRGPVRIIITEDSEGFWVQKRERGNATLALSHEGAMNLARRFFLEKGGEDKAIIIDLTKQETA
jgi:hypothetical protein